MWFPFIISYVVSIFTRFIYFYLLCTGNPPVCTSVHYIHALPEGLEDIRTPRTGGTTVVNCCVGWVLCKSIKYS